MLEVEGLKIITDPGAFTIEAQEKQENIDIVLLTHEHGDHLHAESLKNILEKNPNAHVVSNAPVAALLHEQGIEATHIGGGEHAEVKGIKIEGFGTEHAEIFESFGQVENTGYFVGEKFYFPGDSFFNPKKTIDVLALPVAGPWMRIGHAVKYLQETKPRIAFGVHDGIMQPFFRGFPTALFEKFCPDTQYVTIPDGTSREF